MQIAASRISAATAVQPSGATFKLDEHSARFATHKHHPERHEETWKWKHKLCFLSINLPRITMQIALSRTSNAKAAQPSKAKFELN